MAGPAGRLTPPLLIVGEADVDSNCSWVSILIKQFFLRYRLRFPLEATPIVHVVGSQVARKKIEEGLGIQINEGIPVVGGFPEQRPAAICLALPIEVPKHLAAKGYNTYYLVWGETSDSPTCREMTPGLFRLSLVCSNGFTDHLDTAVPPTFAFDLKTSCSQHARLSARRKVVRKPTEGLTIIAVVTSLQSPQWSGLALAFAKLLLKETPFHIVYITDDKAHAADFRRSGWRLGQRHRIQYVVTPLDSRRYCLAANASVIFGTSPLAECFGSIATAHDRPILHWRHGDLPTPEEARAELVSLFNSGELQAVQQIRHSKSHLDLIDKLILLCRVKSNYENLPRSPRATFIVNNLRIGGAQRSLMRLYEGLQPTYDLAIVSCNSRIDESILTEVHLKRFLVINPIAKGHFWTLDRIFSRINISSPSCICFWNAPTSVKFLLTEFLRLFTHIRSIDVSPGPATVYDLENPQPTKFPSRAAAARYVDTLSGFVQKYRAIDFSNSFPSEQSKLRTIPNGIDIPILKESFEASGLHCDLIDWRNAIVSCSRIVPDKLIVEQLQALSFLRQAIPTATLTVIGDLASDAIYQRRISDTIDELALNDAVFFVGPHSSPREVFPLFRVLLMLSRRQGCPNTSLEAMSVGLPVVANPDGGTAEQVIDGVTGFLCDPDDSMGIAAILARILNEPESVGEVGERARLHVATSFSMRQMVRSYERLMFGNWTNI